jgi:hypothetical protein
MSEYPNLIVEPNRTERVLGRIAAIVSVLVPVAAALRGVIGTLFARHPVFIALEPVLAVYWWAYIWFVSLPGGARPDRMHKRWVPPSRPRIFFGRRSTLPARRLSPER